MGEIRLKFSISLTSLKIPLPLPVAGPFIVHSLPPYLTMNEAKPDRLVIEVLTYCIILNVVPSIIKNNFVRKDNDEEVFHPFHINHINRVVVKALRDSCNSYRSKPLSRSVSVFV